MSTEYHARLGPASGSPDIEEYVTYSTGPFAGRTIRAQVVEVQKADVGRKYVRKDRRPLDPPPIVHLKLFEVLNAESSDAYEEEILCCDEVMSYGFLCHLDLFPVPGDGTQDDLQEMSPQEADPIQQTASDSDETAVSTSPNALTPTPLPPGSTHMESSRIDPPPVPVSFHLMGGSQQMPASLSTRSEDLHLTTPQDARDPSGDFNSAVSSSASAESPIGSNFGASFISTPHLNEVHNARGTSPYLSDVVAYCGDRPVTTASMCTPLLAGTTFCNSSSIDLNGRPSTIFVFSDVAVRSEGMFFLRYRVFYMFAQAMGDRPNPVIAECFGQPFKIYGTKNFPGLHASTALTRVLSINGIRTHIRAQERKRHKTSHSREGTTSHDGVGPIDSAPSPNTRRYSLRSLSVVENGDEAHQDINENIDMEDE